MVPGGKHAQQGEHSFLTSSKIIVHEKIILGELWTKILTKLKKNSPRRPV